VQVRGEFNSGRLTDLSPGVELIPEGDPGWNDLRILTVRVPDHEVYSFAEAAAELPDVVRRAGIDEPPPSVRRIRLV